MEVRGRMHFHDTDFYYRVLGFGIREVLTTDFTDLFKTDFHRSIRVNLS